MKRELGSRGKAFIQGALGLLIGVLSVVGLLVLLSEESSARPMQQAGAILTVAKSASSETVIAGNPLSYVITVTNSGDYVPDIVVTDTLPVGVSDVSTSPGCTDAAQGVITCTVSPTGTQGALSATVGIYLTVDASTRGTITNTAEVSGDMTTELTVVTAQADLEVSKSAHPNPVTAGEALTYTISVTNLGPSDATGVTVTDTLPSNVAFQSGTATAGTYDSTTGAWTLGDLPVDATQTLTTYVSVDPDAIGPISNVARVSGTELDPNPNNDQDSVETTVSTEADLAVSKSAHPNPVTAGEALTYTISVTNLGPSDATGVTVTDTLPSNVAFQSGTATAGTYDSTTGVWTVGDLPVDATQTLIIYVFVDTPLPNGTLLTNVATVAGDQDDPDTTNNTVQTETEVRSAPMLTLTKEGRPESVDAGEQLVYTLTYANTGNETATGAVITDYLDANVIYADADPPAQGTGQTRYWMIDSIVPGGLHQIQMTVTVASPLPNGTVLGNTAWLATDQTEPVSATEQTTVVSSPVLTITKHDNPDPVDAGGTLHYTLILSNSGNENATDVVVRDRFDENVSFFWANPDPDTGTEDTWTFSVLEAGGSMVIDIIVQVAANLPRGTVLTNQATLDSHQTDPVTVTETTEVTSASELTVSKVAVPEDVQAGGILEYIITYQNGGTAAAEGAIITETYDTRVSFVSADPAPETGTDSVWLIGRVAVGDSDLIRVRVEVDTPLTDGTVLTNVVTIDSNHTSPKSYTETTRVSSSPDVLLTVTDRPDPVQAGDRLTYMVSYSNNGNADATGVVLTATLDSNVSFDTAQPAPSGGVGDTRHWSLEDLKGEGGAAEIIIETQVTRPLTSGTVLDFQAQLEYAEGDVREAGAQTEVISAPSLSLTKRDGNLIVYAGDQLTYTLSYANTGNEDAYGVTITDTLPSYVEYVSCQAADGTCTRSGNEVIFEFPVIAANATGVAYLMVQVEDPLPARVDSIRNQATMTHTSLSTPIYAEDLNAIGTRPDLTASAGHEPRLFSPGKEMTYTITYANEGRMHAENVIITTTLPPSTSYVGGGWTSDDDHVYAHRVGRLEAGTVDQTATFVVAHASGAEVGAAEFSTWFMIAEDGTTRGDARPENNAAQVNVGVPDLVVTQFTFEPNPLQVNAPMTFTVTVRNQGTGIAENAALPGGGSTLDIFVNPVASYPWTGYGRIWDYVPPIHPGASHTRVITMTSPLAEEQDQIQFSEKEIRETVQGFWVRVDSHPESAYGLVPEYNEWNNVAAIILRPWTIHLPFVAR